MLFWKRHANFRHVENYLYDPTARIIKHPLNSTTFDLDASTQLRDTSTQLGDDSNFTLNYSSIFRQNVISTWRLVHSTPRRVKNAIMTPMAYHITLDML